MTVTCLDANYDLTAELALDYRRYKHLKFKYMQNIINFELDASLENCSVAINAAEEVFQVRLLMLKKVMSILRQYKDRVVQLQQKIKTISISKSSLKRNRKNKKIRNFLIDKLMFRAQNGKRSYYFKTDTSNFHHRTVDFLEIVGTGHKFLSCMHKSRTWTKNDVCKLFSGVRESLINEKYRQLRVTQRELQEIIKLNPKDSRVDDLQKQQQCLHDFLTKSVDAELNVLLENEPESRDFNWESISKRYFKERHLPEECQQTWHLIAKPSVHNVTWTTEEDILLRQVVIRNRFQAWDKVCEQMARYRSEFQYFVRYQTIWKNYRSAVKKKWTEEENCKLKALAEAKDSFSGLSRKRILLHLKYLNSICDKKRGFYSKREKYFMDLYLKRGYSYSSIAHILGNRTAQQIRDYRRNSFKKSYGRWTSKETGDLLRAVKYIGSTRWTKVSEYVRTRTPMQCRLKFSQLRLNSCREESVSEQRINIRKFLQNAKKKRSNSINKNIELYFIQLLEKETPAMCSKNLLVEHVFSLLNYLNFSVDCPREFSTPVNDWLVNFSSSDATTSKQSFDTIFEDTFKQSASNLYHVNRNSFFCNLLPKSSTVLPPNKCNINGYHTFTLMYDRFIKDHHDINFETYWKQINSSLKENKHFMQAKIMWYRVLKAMFFWPLKLLTVFPEHLIEK